MLIDRPIDLKLEAPIRHGWAKDDLSQFLTLAEQQGWATFVQQRQAFGLLTSVEALLRSAASMLTNTEDIVPALLLLRTHGAYLASVRLAIGTQCPDAYAVMRVCLENALYAFYIHRTPSALAVWVQRHQSAQHKKAARQEFAHSRLIECLKKEQKRTAQAIEELYERTIDLGAHPNERSISANMKMLQEEVRLNHLTDDALVIKMALKTACDVGIASVALFRNVFRERFDLSGLSDKIDGIIKDLGATTCFKR